MTEKNANLANARSKLISRLIRDRAYRAAYVRAKLEVLIPSQLRALRLRKAWTQSDLASAAGKKQSQISAMETPGKVNFNLETLVEMSATFGVGLQVRFVPLSEMLRWENDYSQDFFDVTSVEHDTDFLNPEVGATNQIAVAPSFTELSAEAVQQANLIACGGNPNGTTRAQAA